MVSRLLHQKMRAFRLLVAVEDVPGIATVHAAEAVNATSTAHTVIHPMPTRHTPTPPTPMSLIPTPHHRRHRRRNSSNVSLMDHGAQPPASRVPLLIRRPPAFNFAIAHACHRRCRRRRRRRRRRTTTYKCIVDAPPGTPPCQQCDPSDPQATTLTRCNSTCLPQGR